MQPGGQTPETHYANNGGVHIAYQVVGDGPIDLVFVMGWITHMDYFWLEPGFARFNELPVDAEQRSRRNGRLQ